MGEFADLIRRNRLEKGLTQLELAKHAGVEGPYISQIEKGEKVPSIGVAGKLALALDLDRETVINLALKEKAPEEAKAFFKELKPRYPRLRELLLSRCQNRSEVEPELSRAEFSKYENLIVFGYILAALIGSHLLPQEELGRVVQSRSEEEPAFANFYRLLDEMLEYWRFDFGTWNLVFKLQGQEPVRLMRTGSGITFIAPSRVEGLSKEADQWLQIPVVGLVEAGKGGFYDDQGYPVGQGMYSVSRPYDIKDPNAYGVEVAGDSMVPRLYERDVVLASPAKQVLSGDLAVIRLADDEVVIKRVRFKDDLVILESVNPTYEPRILTRHEVKFMHRVVWIKPH